MSSKADSLLSTKQAAWKRFNKTATDWLTSKQTNIMSKQKIKKFQE